MPWPKLFCSTAWKHAATEQGSWTYTPAIGNATHRSVPSSSARAHRGAMLALRVRSIGEAARLAVEDNKTGRPTFRRWRDRPARDGAAAPIAPIALQVVTWLLQ